MNDEKKGVKKMRTFAKSSKLDNVCYDIRGPVMDEANRMIEQGVEILKLNIGNPAPFGFKAPQELVDMMRGNLENAEGYSDSRGLLKSRQAIVEYCKKKNIPNVGVNDIYTGNGVSELITLSMNGLLDNGDEVLVPSPDYPLWTASVTLAGGKAVHYLCDEQSNWYPDIADMRKKITDKTKGIVIINPNNPTGAIMTKEELEELVPVIIEKDLYVISDEIYAELTYGGKRHCSIGSLPGMKERTIVINGFSKAFAMTGWRLGYACGPAPVIEQMVKLHQFAIMCAPTNSQFAAVEALKNCDMEVEMMVEAYDQRRRFLLNAFKEMGLECFEPYGAFYVFPSIKKFGMTSEEFATRLLSEQKLAVVPGTAFGASGEGFVRISYAYSIENLKVGLERIQKFIESLGGNDGRI